MSSKLNFKPIALFLFGCVSSAMFLVLMKPDFLFGKAPSEQQHSGPSASEPLYWVAPMDPNYKRDKPGKSPMGMDLVPVYPTEASSEDDQLGVVRIEPHVVNNFGVRTEQVQVGKLKKRISTVGYVQFDEDRLIHIHPRVEGWIETLFIKSTGEPVQQGQPLYTMYSPQMVNAQEELLIALKRDNNALIKAAKERLHALKMSEEFIENLSKNKSVRQSVTFYARQSGVIADLKIREGFYVKPGMTLMSIGQLEQVWVAAEVFERDVALVAAGFPVEMTLDYLPGKRWSGKVDYVYPTLNSDTRTVRVRMKFANADKVLKPNMFAQVAIQVESNREAVLVPKDAVIRTGSQNRVVLKLDDGGYKSIAVSLGQANSHQIEILDGLNAGDSIVTSAQFLIDSESSKTSDFRRMSKQPKTTDAEDVPTATVMGNINSIDAVTRVVNISRGAIPKWDRPAATMDFILANDLDINVLREGMHVMFTFEIKDDFIITEISEHVMNHKQEPSDSKSTGSEGVKHD